MTVKPNVGSGLVYVNGILIDDTKVRTVSTEQSETFLRIESKAQDHTTGKIYNIRIVEEGTAEKPEVLADFHFDDEETGFTNGYAVAKGTYSLQDHDGGKALYLDGTSNFLEVTKENGESLLTGVGEMTISFQAKPESSASNWGFFAAPNETRQEYQQEHYAGILNNKGNILVERYNNAGARPASASASAGTNDWHYVTVVHTQNETILYINGEEKARQASAYDLRDILGNNSILYIGKANWEAGEYYKGLIDNYKIMSYAMTADEVKAMVEGKPGVTVDSVEVTAPSKTEYKAGEDLNLDGMKVVAKYSDGTTQEIPAADCKVSGYDKNKAGKQTVTVTYRGKSAVFTVTVAEKDPEVTVDKAALQKAIADAVPETDKDKYTESSWALYAAAVDKAKEVEADADATQAAVDAAVAALNAAEKALEKKPDRPFVDVDMETGDWYYDAVYYNYDRKIMNGVNNTHFEPLSNLARAQFAIILHNMEDKPAATYEPKFKDVAEDQWYTDAVMWASSNKIVTGYTDGSETFGWGDNILREQMAVMMYRYAKDFKKYDVSDSADFDKFEDAASVSGYAKEAMKWAVGSGIITGKYEGTKIDPQGYASRAECAIIIQRFLKEYSK